MKQQFLYNTAGTFKAYVYEHNRKLVPTSATITVYEPASSSILITGSMAVAADGLLSYALTAADNDDAKENYKVVIAYVSGGSTFYLTLFYDVVKSILAQVITDDDLINELPQLRDKQWLTHGVVDSGSTTTLIDAELKRYADDFFTGGLATNLTKDESREITDFTASSGTVTTVAFSAANAASDKYQLQRSFSKEIQRAFEKLESMLFQAGRRAYLVLDSSDLREVHILLSVAETCKGFITSDGGSMWSYFFDLYDKRSYAIFKSLNLKYDSSQDGYVSAEEENARIKRTIGRT